MPNPFYTNNLQNVYNMLRNSNNPQQLFNQIAQNNPTMQPIVQALNNGGNPQQLFYSLCQQRGIDPQTFLKQITGNNT